MACAVMVGVVLQAFLLAGLRTAERAHFHSTPAFMPSWQSLDAHAANAHHADDAEDQAGGDARGHPDAHPHPHPHNHTHAAIHDHGSDRHDVVYVSSDLGDDTPLPALTRLPLGLDGYFLKADLPNIPLPIRVMFAIPPSHFGTRTELPLERPPRTRA